jgi:hypothetical protein
MRYLIALTAVLMVVFGFSQRASAQVLPTSWYGYVVTGSTYTSTTADWTMPSITCGADSANYNVSIWTGLDGYESDSVEQVGALAYCVDETAEYFGWYELYPEYPAVEFTNTLKPGDKLDASVTYDGSSKFTLTLEDVTQGWDESVPKTLAGAARSSAETVVGIPGASGCVGTRTYADFTGDTVDGKLLGSLDPTEVTGSNPDILVSAVSGGSFSVTCR